MDDNNRNLILAMVLSALVMVGWYAFFAPPPPEPTDPAVATQTAPGAIAPTAPAEQAPAPVEEAGAGAARSDIDGRDELRPGHSAAGACRR